MANKTDTLLDRFASIEELISRHATSSPDRVAVVCQGRKTTYGGLWQQTLRIADELRNGGVAEGMLCPFRTTQDELFLCRYMAAHLVGAAAVPLGADMPEGEYEAMRSRLSAVRLSVPSERRELVADVLFTTGSTGRQKGVMLSRRAILADTDNLIEAQGFSAATNFVICGPLNHIGSLSKTWPVLALGGKLTILDGMKDIGAFFAALSRGSHVATFMVPASIRMALRLGQGDMERLARSVEFIETGGAAITQGDMEALCRLLPEARLYNTYASTEAGIVCTYDYNHNPCVAGCVGPTMRHSSISVAHDGTISVSGPTLMSGYLDDPATTAEILNDGTLLTTDLGSLDASGMLHLTGRNSDVINIGGYKISPIEVEDAAMSHPLVADCVCHQAESPLFGTTIKLVYVVAPRHTLTKQQLARHIAQRMEPYKLPRLYEQVSSIRHLFNGKVDRKFYAENG